MRSFRSVFQERLPSLKHTPDGSDLSSITIKFALSVSGPGNTNADELQAEKAVTEATRAIDALGSTPAPVAVLSSAVDVGSKVVSGAEAFDNTWGTLLKRIELFNKIVASIAEVF